MKIKITPTNANKIEAELASANSKASAHTYTTYTEIENIANRAESEVLQYLSKKDIKGAEYTSRSGSKMPNCYKGIRNVTTVSMTRTSSGWFLTSVNQSHLWPNEKGFNTLTLTKEQKDIAVKKFLSKFIVKL